LRRLYPTNLTTLFTTKQYYTYGSISNRSPLLRPYYVQKATLCNPEFDTHHETYFYRTAVSIARKKKIGVETVIDVTNAKPPFLLRCRRRSLVAVQRRGLTNHHLHISTHRPQFLLSTHNNYNTMPRATHLALHVSWHRSCSSIDDCTPRSRARRTRTSTRASFHLNSTLPRSYVDWVPERLRPGNWLPNCEGGACSLQGCVTGSDVRWVS